VFAVRYALSPYIKQTCLVLKGLMQFLVIYQGWQYSKEGPGSTVGIATGYGLGGLGIESWWGPPSLLYNGYRVFLKGKEWPGGGGVTLTPHPFLVPLVKKG
jgi:hypothetical protein